MKSVIIILSSIIAFTSNLTAQITGQWKCDQTGKYVFKNQNDETESAPIKKFYTSLNMLPLEIRLEPDMSFKIISSVKNTDDMIYSYAYGGDPSKVLIRQVDDHSEDMVMTLKHLTLTRMEADFYSIEDEFTLKLKFDKVDKSHIPTLEPSPYPNIKISNSGPVFISVDHGIISNQVSNMQDCTYKCVELSLDKVSQNGTVIPSYFTTSLPHNLLQSFIYTQGGFYNGTAWWCEGKLIDDRSFCNQSNVYMRLTFKM